MARLTPIPDADDLLRHVRKKHLAFDPDTDAPVGFTPQAFELREGETSLSAAWPQYFEGTRSQQSIRAIGDVGATVEIRKNDRFARGLVGEIKSACAEHEVQVRIVHDGQDYACHASVRRFGNATLELFEKLARQAWAEMLTPSLQTVAASRAARAARG